MVYNKPLRVINDHLSDIWKTCFGESKGCSKLKLKRSECICIIENILMLHFKDDLQNDNGHKNFNLLIDESNDVCSKDTW